MILISRHLHNKPVPIFRFGLFCFVLPQMRRIITSFLHEYPAALINRTNFSLMNEWGGTVNPGNKYIARVEAQ